MNGEAGRTISATSVYNMVNFKKYIDATDNDVGGTGKLAAIKGGIRAPKRQARSDEMSR